MTDHARCNQDGRPIHPDDQVQLDRFAEFLSMTEARRQWVLRTDPVWRAWLGIKDKDGS